MRENKKKEGGFWKKELGRRKKEHRDEGPKDVTVSTCDFP